ncbi:MAG: glycoside hydrolase family 30 protein [Dysgonomonas sp.]
MKSIHIFLASLCLFFFSCVDYNTDSGFASEDDSSTENNEARLWITNSTRVFLMKEVPVEYSSDITDLTVKIDPTVKYQTIDGFGGGLTGSSAYLFKQMSAAARAKVLKDLFDPKDGIGLENIRLCIGSSDFSTSLYTYCDTQGIDNFAIPQTDKEDLIPVLKEILAINPNIKIIASPWSPPAWMKTSGQLNYGSLKPEYYADFAEYFVKYVKAMSAEGITIDAITLQNEPEFESYTHPSMLMPWETQSEIIGQYLGPRFAAENIKTKILTLDHNFDIYEYALNVLNNSAANNYTAGTAFHGYAGTPSVLDNMTAAFPDKSIYITELSGGGWNTGSEMETFLYYLKDFLVPSLQKGSSNFMMFNIALNTEHGPVTPGGTFCEDCRGIITVDGDNYTKELEYYMLGQFAKVCRTGAKRIKTSFIGTLPSNVTATAFLNPDGSRSVVIVNESGNKVDLTVKDESTNKRLVYSLANDAVASFLLK